MARIRSVKPELRRDLTVASWPFEVRYFWVLLWGYCDDKGRGDDDPRLLKSDCFPLDDAISARKVDGYVERMRGDGRVCRYEVDERRLLHVINWRHQKINRPTKSVLAPCPHHERAAYEEYRKSHAEVVNLHGALTEDSGSDPGIDTEGSLPDLGSKGARERGSARERATSPPENIEITDAMRTWAASHAPDVRLVVETARLLDWARGGGHKKVDWTATWRNWMSREQDKINEKIARQPPAQDDDEAWMR